jgi:hypothetical protein
VARAASRSSEWASSSGEWFWSWPEVAGWFRDPLGAEVEVPPHELRTAARLLGAGAARWTHQALLARPAVAPISRPR